jgi:predicted TPR repeat methyltransferase
MNNPSPKALIEQAESQLSGGNLASAIALYRRIPTSSLHGKKARRALKSLQKNHPAAVMEADLKELIGLHESQSHKQALSLARKLSRSYPDQPLPHNVMGTVHMARGQFEEAARCFQHALELAPDFLDARNNLGAAYNSLKDYDGAIECLQRVIAARPSGQRAHTNMGIALRETNQLEAAVHSFERALTIEPDNSSALLNLGKTLMKMHEFEEAITWYRRAIESAPDQGDAHYDLGLVYLQLGDRAEASRHMRKALELTPGSVEIEHFLAAAEGDSSRTAPAAYVASLFDGYADTFDDHLVKSLNYSAPRQLHQLMKETGTLAQRFSKALDLGCGTGLCGEQFQAYCMQMDGIDLSEKMLAVAKEKGVYNRLFNGDIAEIISQLGETFDLFISADTFIYVGELTATFETIAAHANPGALFTFSTESGYRQDVELLGSGRYCHSKDYISSLASGSGFELVSYSEQNLRTEKKQWLKGGYYLLRYIG